MTLRLAVNALRVSTGTLKGQFPVRLMGKHAHAIDLTRLDASYAAMLQGARLMQK